MSSSAYSAANTPRDGNGQSPDQMIQETSRGISSLNQLLRTMHQKLSLVGTPQDSRSNHQQLTELMDKGNKLIQKLQRRLQELTRGPAARTRKAQISKLTNDLKAQVKRFEEACERLRDVEASEIEELRRSSASSAHSFHVHDEKRLFDQAQVTNFEEDDLVRREEDLIHINHKLREVNAAFREVDDLVREQGEVVVQVEENADEAKEQVEDALDNVRQADASRKYCACSKCKLIVYSTLIIILVLLIVSLVLGFKGKQE